MSDYDDLVSALSPVSAALTKFGIRHYVITSKLEWYRKTNETSERQWDDVTRLLKLLGDAADIEYLKGAAESVGVHDLLERLLSAR
ncbi:MAG: hypothetical protein NT069_19985 [Planctomycetota bacterium]|nr:hypothetical protein [Planctomycetota bacterium]